MLNESCRQRISEMEGELAKLLSARFRPFTKENADAIPQAPGIYLIKENDTIVYAGSTQNLKLRLWTEHYLGEQVRKVGSQFRGNLSKQQKLNANQLTEYIANRCSFAFLAKDPVKKRDLKFLEDFCNAILRPNLIKYDPDNRVWSAPRKRKHHIIYKCDDCGREFPSGRRRSGLKLCKDCAEKRRREGRGPRQHKST